MRHWFRVHTVVVVYFPVLASADDVERFFGDYTRAILCVDSWFRVDLGILSLGWNLVALLFRLVLGCFG